MSETTSGTTTNQEAEAERWISIKAAAETMSVCRETIARMVKRGDLRARKVLRNRVQISVKSIEEHLTRLNGDTITPDEVPE